MSNHEACSKAEKIIEEAVRSKATTIRLWSLDLTELPESLLRLSRLRVLDLRSNRLTSLPEWLHQFTQLEDVELGRNQLTSLPEWLCQHTRLHSLDLSGNRLSSLPESLGALTKLSSLALSMNMLTSLPESLCQLSSLRVLTLNGNQLASLPESVGQLTNLRDLRLGNNQLTSLPESVGQMSGLETIWLEGNRLQSLPESLGSLSGLTELRLENNLLTSLPQSFGKLSQLRKVCLSSNRLTALPESLGQLSRLQELCVECNTLASLPQSLRGVGMLGGLFLHGNPGLGLRADILGPTAEDVHTKNMTPNSPSDILDQYFSRGEGRATAELVQRAAVEPKLAQAPVSPERREPQPSAVDSAVSGDRSRDVAGEDEPPSPTEGDDFIFVSYKREDLARIAPFMRRIVSWGYAIWYDRGISGGSEWNAVIDDHVSRCKGLVVFLSQAAVESKMVRREMILADKENRPIVGIRLDKGVEFKHGLKGMMAQYQVIDATSSDFSDQLAKAIKYVRLL